MTPVVEPERLKGVAERVATWADERTGLVTAARSLFNEEIPASAGWHQVFGSVALFCFLVQAFTGILLAFYYVLGARGIERVAEDVEPAVAGIGKAL